jgi:hypothetical protein
MITPEDFYKKCTVVDERLEIYGVARIAESCTDSNGKIKYRVEWKGYRPV